MFKIKGKIYPISLLKCYISDESAAKLDFMLKIFKAKTFQEIIEPLIDKAYNKLILELQRLDNEKENKAEKPEGDTRSISK